MESSSALFFRYISSSIGDYIDYSKNIRCNFLFDCIQLLQWKFPCP